MRAALSALLLLLPVLSARAQDDDVQPLRRSLVELRLGDGLKRARGAYPPLKEWPSTVEKRTGVTRYRLEKAETKSFPAHVETVYLGFKKERLVEIEVVYDEEKSRTLSVQKLADAYALIYGGARRSDERFWWSDRKTVLRVFPALISSAQEGGRALAERTAVQVFDKGAFKGD